MTPAGYAWCGIGGFVLAYNLAAEDGETLSEGADRVLLRHPWLVRLCAYSVASHIVNAVPVRYDPIHWVFTAARAFYPLRRKVAEVIAPPD